MIARIILSFLVCISLSPFTLLSHDAYAESNNDSNAISKSNDSSVQTSDTTSDSSDISVPDISRATDGTNENVTPNAKSSSESSMTAQSDQQDSAKDAQLSVSTESQDSGDTDGNASDAHAQITVICEVIGPDQTSNSIDWFSPATFSISADATAADLTEAMFEKSGLQHTSGMGTYGYYLSSIASPGSDNQIGFDNVTGKYWQLFINGVSSNVGASDVHLHSHDVVVWKYAAYGETLNDDSSSEAGSHADGDVDVFPDEPHQENPDDVWSGFATGNSMHASTTPTDRGQAVWQTSMKDATDWRTNVSSPVIFNDAIYIAVGNTIKKIDRNTGHVVQTSKLAADIDSIARMRCADGLLIVPLAKGRVQALSLQTLRTVWITSALPAGDDGDQQSLGTPFVDGTNAYVASSSAGGVSSSGGYLYAISLENGNTKWTYANDRAGYYWDGATILNGWLVIADERGEVSTFSPFASTGIAHPAYSYSLGHACKSTAVSSGDGTTFFVTTTDGCIHKLQVNTDGSVSEIAHASFAASSTGTVSVENGYVAVGGATQDYHGVLAIFDTDLHLISQVTQYRDAASGDSSAAHSIPGEIKSTPLMVSENGNTYIYVTANANPGGIYVYRIGNTTASALFSPDSAHAQFCMDSVIADENGNLYYVNDSGTLFKVGKVAHSGNESDVDDSNETSSDDGQTDNAFGLLPSAEDSSDANLLVDALQQNGNPTNSAYKRAASAFMNRMHQEKRFANAASGKSSATHKTKSPVYTAQENGSQTDTNGQNEQPENAQNNASTALNSSVSPFVAIGIGIGIAGLCVAVYLFFRARN